MYLQELKPSKETAAEASARYEKFKKMFAAGVAGVTQHQLDGIKAKVDSLWDSEMGAKEKNMIDTHGADWWELVQKQYPITEQGNKWLVTSEIRDWHDAHVWEFDSKYQAKEKVIQLAKWISQARNRGFGDRDADVEKFTAKLDALDKAKAGQKIATAIE